MRAKSMRNMLGRLLADDRGSSDLTVTLLLTAAGAVMVGLTVPAMFKSSDTAARTFDHQVQILERGAKGGSMPSGMGGMGGMGGLPSIPGMGGLPTSGFDLGLPGGGSAPLPMTTAGGPLTPKTP